MGLSLPGMKRKGTTTFAEHIKELNLFPKLIMGFYFRPIGYNKKGAFMIGGLNKSYYHEPINYYKVTDPSYWKVLVTQIRVYITD